MSRGGDVVNILGMKFGRLTVVERAGSSADWKALWRCVCDCGQPKIADGGMLRQGHVRSCGCLAKESSARNSRASAKHGYKGSRLYRIWAGMKTRCANPRHHETHRYGARGIKVCDEWLEFIPFKDWALSSGYRDDLTIDRINGDSGYHPSNCRWVTMFDQQNNRCNNHRLTFSGRTETISEWARQSGIPKDTLRYRISKLGWSVELALTKPVRGRSSCQSV